MASELDRMGSLEENHRDRLFVPRSKARRQWEDDDHSACVSLTYTILNILWYNDLVVYCIVSLIYPNDNYILINIIILYSLFPIPLSWEVQSTASSRRLRPGEVLLNSGEVSGTGASKCVGGSWRLSFRSEKCGIFGMVLCQGINMGRIYIYIYVYWAWLLRGTTWNYTPED